ncbi:MAG: hypothetical protein V1863_00510, partial [Candidatus Omnitrophota bacterium]
MKTIPVFPSARPLEFKDKPLLDRLFKSYPPVISEFTFTNLFAWRRAYDFYLASLDDVVLVISEKEGGVCTPRSINPSLQSADKGWPLGHSARICSGGLHVFDPLAKPGEKARIIEQCFQKAGPAAKLTFRRLPETTIALVKGMGFRIEEDRDN